MYLCLPTAFTRAHSLSSVLHPPWAQTWAHRSLQDQHPSPGTGLFPPMWGPPCHRHRGLSQRFPPSCSWSGLAGSAEEIWKGNLKGILLEVARLPVGFGELISINMSYLATLNQIFPVIQYVPHHVSLFCIIESGTFEGVPTSFLDLSWSSVCWSHCSWDKLYPHQKVKCDEPGAQVLNVVCLDWSE